MKKVTHVKSEKMSPTYGGTQRVSERVSEKSGGGAPESKTMAKDTCEKDVHAQLRTCEIPSAGATLEMSLRPKLFLGHK